MTVAENKKAWKDAKKNYYGKPGAVAVSRVQAGGDWAAGMLLYRVKFHFKEGKKQLERFEKLWVAMPRSAWALEAGLTESEMKNRALPKLRKRQFIEVRGMKLRPNGPKLLWISLDLGKLSQWTDPEDMVWPILNGAGIGMKQPTVSYSYKEKT
jgi:hypothetical protein